jgi:queuine tRNA-ribosyltransferase
MFTLKESTEQGRRGVIETPHGTIETPFFMPVGTAGAMKGLTHADLLELSAQILLCNTYHLHLHPGEDTIEEAGGLHGFINWKKPILTDSGGFQVFSLRNTREITNEGVHFRSHVNGDPLYLDPESAITIQHKFGADIIMCFDECPASTASHEEIQSAVDRTLRWAQKCKDAHTKLDPEHRIQLFGIIQGGLDQNLRRKCTEELIAIGFDGYAVGGLAVGESEEEMYDVLDTVCPLLPEDAPRYLMGVGVIEQLKECVAKGIDMFDCVHPLRIARHGTILLSDGSSIRIQNAEYKEAHEPIDPDSPSDLSRSHTKSYLHHLVKTNERLGETIASKQNLAVTLKAMQDLRR